MDFPLEPSEREPALTNSNKGDNMKNQTRKNKDGSTSKTRRGRPAGAVNNSTLDLLAAEGIDLETYIKVKQIIQTKKSA